MTCLELVKGPGSKEPWGTRHAYIKALGETVHNKDLLTRVWNQLHVSPPLVVTREEIDRMVTIIDESLTEVESRFAGEIETAA
jgi:adenosylmethionine-8-amino-7-oxononanoate aminotransferase